MATITLSPTPAPIAAMSSRRGPLTSNPHAANSPLRAPSALFQNGKVKRSYANTQREETYGQPPPIKKQALEDGTSRAVRSPSKLPRSQQLPQRTASQVAGRPPIKERTTSRLPTVSRTVQDDEHKEVWKKHYRAKFPKMVFYFESIPDDVRAKLTKRVIYLGAVSPPLPFDFLGRPPCLPPSSPKNHSFRTP
jgi:regulatory subunit for Cdc7p protein kinase